MNNKPNQNNQKEKERLELEEYLPFNGTVSCMLINSYELSKLFNRFFKSAFQDCEGCYITPNNYGKMDVTLYFKLNSGVDIEPLVSANNRNANISQMDRIRNMQLRNATKTLKLSERTKELLEDLMRPTNMGFGGNRKIDWNKVTAETSNRNAFNLNTIYMSVSNLDINKIFKKLYGGKNENGERIDYDATFMNPIGGMSTQNGANIFMIKVDRINAAEVESLASKMGMLPMAGSIPMVRDI